MGVSLSIKNVPDAVAEALRRRASANHRSLQRELMAIVEAATAGEAAARPARARPPEARESEGRYIVTAPSAGGTGDGLLAELDAIVAGSAWGQAPLLTREQAHDRGLTRERDLDTRADELARARQRARRSAAK